MDPFVPLNFQTFTKVDQKHNYRREKTKEKANPAVDKVTVYGFTLDPAQFPSQLN